MKKKNKFGAKLQEWRKSKGFIQKQAADFLGVSVDRYRSWEYGFAAPHKTPSMNEITNLIGKA